MVKTLKLLVLVGLLTSCVEKQFTENPQESYSVAKEPYDDHNYEIAIKKLGEFKSRFPYSRFAIEAELLVANSYFELGKYAESSVAYEQFAKLHPKHPELDFVLYRIGLAYWKDAPGEIDREQEYTDLAIKKWERLVKEYPQSRHSSEAKQFMESGKRRIAESERFIARFYCNRKEIWHACAYRSLLIIDRFGDFKDIKMEAEEKAAYAFRQLAKSDFQQSDAKNIFFKEMTQEQMLKKAQELESQMKVE